MNTKPGIFSAMLGLLALCTLISTASAAVIYVPDNYTNIQWAVDNATAGDTVIVRDGTYSENVNVDKQLTIHSENGYANCIVQAANPDENVFWVAADYVSISGFTATGTTGTYPSYTAGIHLYDADNCIISNNNASNNHHGIYLRSSSNYNTLTNNTVNSNVYGIHLSSDSNILISNTANSNTYGICLSPGPNTLRNNAMNNNTYNFNFGGWSTNFSAYCHDIDTSNTVDGRPIYYWSYKKDAEISDLNNAGFVALVSCDNITVKNLNVHNNSHGIFLVNTTNSNVLNNTASSNEYGIFLTWYSNNNTLTDNIVNSNGDGIHLSHSNNSALTNNTLNSNDNGIHLYSSNNNALTNNAANSNGRGIYLYSSNNNALTNNAANSNGRGIYLRDFSICNTLTNNIVNSNGDGIYLDCSNNNTLSNNAANSNTNGLYLDYSINNLIYNNYFNNTNNAYAYPHYVGNNIWNITKTEGTNVIGGSYLGGNYWSDYEGEDLNGDGLGDTLLPYNSSGKIQNGGDYLPLVSGGVAPLPPVANFSYTPENPVVNEDITFNASDSFDPDGTIANYEWNFGDGATLNTIDPVTMHTYSSSGTYTVTLTVTDDDALTGSTFREIVVLSQEEIYSYRTDFDELDKNYWYAAEWVTLTEAYDKVRIENGTLVIPVEQADRGPIVFFKPFEVKKGDIVKIKRKALVHYANQYFMGSLGLYQADNDNLIVEPDPALEQWWKAYAQYPVVRVDYLHYYYTPDNKPTTDGFVVRGIDYIIADSIFDQWFEEEVIYNTETGEVTYILNGQEFKVNGSSLEEDTFLRLAMDSYGWYTGHYAKVDYFEVEVTKSTEEPVHNLNTGENFSTIQAAIDGANTVNGHTITADAGTYNENVNVDKQLTIRSASGNPADTIVQAASSSDHVFEVTADYVNVRGFAVKGATTNTKAGIYLGSSIDHCNISDNNASNNYYGIYLHSSSSNTLTNNTASNNDEDGIFLYSSSNYNTLAGNTVSNNDYGIHLYYHPGSNLLENNNVLNNTLQGIVLLSSSNGNTLRNNSVLNNDWHAIHLDNSDDNILANNNVSGNGYGLDLQSSNNNTLTGNLMFGNGRNFGVSGDTDADFDNNIDTTNLVDGKSVYYIKSISGEIFNNTNNTNAGVIYCIQCDAITIKDIALASNGYAGIFFRKTNNSIVGNVSISDNSRGIYLRSSSNNTLTCCTVSNNYYGVYLFSSSNNTIYNNYFNNTHNAYDNENNIWNITKTAGANIVGGSYLGGNYWGDYKGEDLNDDGLGDTMLPYNYGITNGGDHLPLIHVHSTKGDLNSDGTLTPADAAIALEIAAGGSASCDAAALAAADVSGDGCVTSLDALMILQAAAGKIEL